MGRVCAALAGVLLTSAAAGNAAAQDRGYFGALAYDTTSGAYGLANDYPDAEQASARALRACGSGCRIVLTYNNQCGAYAHDTEGGRAYGWGTSKNADAAKARAIEECHDRGGRCAVRVWGCTTR